MADDEEFQDDASKSDSSGEDLLSLLEDEAAEVSLSPVLESESETSIEQPKPRKSPRRKSVQAEPSSEMSGPSENATGEEEVVPLKSKRAMKQQTLNGDDAVTKKPTKKKAAGKDDKDKKEDISDLPPIADIEEIFADMVKRISAIEDVAKQLDGRKLRVATMCSGTESPLLALRLISRALKEQKGLTLEVEHVFSAEIEPFKQAYIERNFAPPLLFRDVTELPEDQAHTAFGSLVDVPGDVDVLIAGTSCKDFSNLNVNKGQPGLGLGGTGTSGSTFLGMRNWVKRHRPALVILENVCNAPWDEVVEQFSKIDYDAHHIRVDTKQYYIPHTRTRGYAIAVPGTYAKKHGKRVKKDTRREADDADEGEDIEDDSKTKKGGKGKLVFDVPYKDSSIPKLWEKRLKEYSRPASVPLEEFLLAADDPLLVRARRDLATSSRRGGETDWSRCEDRHAQARAIEELGQRRPLTSWEAGGRAQLFMGGWLDWALGQTERVLDLMEIQYLRLVLGGIDPLYKTIVWNLSQNVDRQGGNAKFAICPCLTPTMIPFITNRGGPASGLEALRLQGIPTRELLLTRESESDLADLAGNAMTSTVVGAAIVAGLSVVVDKIISRIDERKSKAENEDSMDTDEQADRSPDDRIRGDELLKAIDMDLAKCDELSPTLFADAARSARLCVCEGRATTTAARLLRCADCGETCCENCAGRPQHRLEPLTIDRLPCADFEKELKGMIPMRLSLTGFDLDALRELDHTGIKEQLWTSYIASVSDAIEGTEFRFQSLKRQAVWSVTYAASKAHLVLFLDAAQPEWRLTVSSPPDEKRDSPLRALLKAPVARLKIDRDAKDLLAGTWDIRAPVERNFELTMQGGGERVPTWKADLGLLKDNIRDQERWTEITICVDADEQNALDVDVSGLYRLLPNCGTAEGMLHKRVDAPGTDAPQLYLFLDPSRDGPGEEDFAVISTDPHRHDYGFVRPIICQLDPKWRPFSDHGKLEVKASVRSSWTPSPDVRCIATASVAEQMPGASQSAVQADDSATCALPAEPLSIQLDASTCEHAQNIVDVRVPVVLKDGESGVWPKEAGWHDVDLTHKAQKTFEALAWATERLPSLDVMSEFTQLDVLALDAPQDSHSCLRCAPSPPSLKWVEKDTRKKKAPAKEGDDKKKPAAKLTWVACEDQVEAGAYEQALKKRPPPFVVQLKHENGVGEFRIGLNIAALIHRALGRLPADGPLSQITTSWRMTVVDPNDLILAYRPKASFEIGSNSKDKMSAQPPSFIKQALRPEQRRALTWMKSQENLKGPAFIEEEVSEAFLAPMGWRAEGRAERPRHVYGGVLADEVGFGKTATTVALVDATRELDGPEIPSDVKNTHITTDATLIIVPAHLCNQWPSEIKKFTGKALTTVVIKDMAGLRKVSIEEIEEADIVVASTTLFNSLYWQRTALFGCSEPVPHNTDGKATRRFLARAEDAVSGVGRNVQMLQSKGPKAVRLAIKEAIKSGKAVMEDEKKGAASKIDRADPWELSECEGKKFGKVIGAPLHAFHFKRIVIDEYTYLDGQQRAAMTALSGSFRWILSGTPPLADFTEISSIASLLKVHLGVRDADDAEGTYMKNAFDREMKLRRDDSTQAEQFHVFREMHSTAWHLRRDQVAQTFLDRFARCNKAEIEKINMEESLQKVVLTPAERAIYLELEHHIQNADYQMSKLARLRKERTPKTKAAAKKADAAGSDDEDEQPIADKKGDGKVEKAGAINRNKAGDRELRMGRALGQSATPQEALLKRCSHFTLDLQGNNEVDHAEEAADMIKAARERDLADAKRDLEDAVGFGADLHRHLRKHGVYDDANETETERWPGWVRNVFHPSSIPDREVVQMVQDIVKGCGVEDGGRYLSTTRKTSDQSAEFVEFLGEEGAKFKDNGKKDQLWKMRTHMTMVKRLVRELATRVRSLRFFNVVRKVQQGLIDPHTSKDSDYAESDVADEPLAVLSCCGHTAPYSLMVKKASKQACVVEECDAAVRATSVVRCETLVGEQTHTVFGTKLEQIVDLVKRLPEGERILIFVQFSDLLKMVNTALKEHDIACLTIEGNSSNKSKCLQEFQEQLPHKNSKNDEAFVARVLLLDLSDASASGANLTVANHAIFVSPLFQDAARYKATETQAIGRIRRCGQTKDVHVWRFIATDTIDRQIYGERSGRAVEEIDSELDACKVFKISKAQIAVSQRIKDDRRKNAKADAEPSDKPKGKGKASESKVKAGKKRKGPTPADEDEDEEPPSKPSPKKKAKKSEIVEVEDESEAEPEPKNDKGKGKVPGKAKDDMDVDPKPASTRSKTASPKKPVSKPASKPSSSKEPPKKGILESFFAKQTAKPEAGPSSKRKAADDASASAKSPKRKAAKPTEVKPDSEDSDAAPPVTRSPPARSSQSLSILIEGPPSPKKSSESVSSPGKQSRMLMKGGMKVIADSDDDE